MHDPGRFRLFILLALFQQGFGFLSAQTSLKVEELSVNEGLSNNVVYYMLQDKKGFLWIATHDGLNRYDGYNFKKFQENVTEKKRLAGNLVTGLYEDQEGFLWVSTDKGIVKMNPVTEETIPFIWKDNTPKNHPASFNKDDNNYQLFHSLKVDNIYPGLYEMKSRTLQRAFYSEDILANYGIASCKSKNGDTWTEVKVRDGYRYYYFDQKKKVFTRELPFTPPQNEYLDKHHYLGLHRDAGNHIWVLESTRLRVIDEKGNEKTLLDGFFRDPQIRQNLPLISEDRKGNIWLQVADKLICMDWKSQKAIYTIHQSQLKGVNLKDINCLLLDNSDVLWLGTFYGIRKIILYPQQIGHFTKEENGKGLANNFIIGLSIAPGNKLVAKHYFSDTYYSLIELSSRSVLHRKVESLSIKDYYLKLLGRIDGVNPRLFLHRINDIEGKSHFLDFADLNNRIASPESDSIWLPVVQKGSDRGYLFHIIKNEIIRLTGVFEAWISDGPYFWVADAGGGLLRYDKLKKETRCFRNEKDDPGSISSNVLTGLLMEENGNLWIGTRGGGLNYFDRETGKFIRYSQKEGLPGNSVYSLVLDNDKNLWLGTDVGISCLDHKTKTFHNFYTDDGFLNAEFNRFSAVKDQDGILYFGGMSGIDYFDPAALLQRHTQEPVQAQIVNIRVGNEERGLQQNQVFPYRNNFIQFELAAMNFRNPSGNRFMYQLEGLSTEWVELKNNHSVSFASLLPGQYVFRIKGATREGSWGPATSFSFRINTPWWRSWWFYTLCGLLVVIPSWAFYRYRIRQLKKLLSIRTKISQDLHDEVGASLSGISMLGHVAQLQLEEEKPKEAKTILGQISAYSDDTIERISDIVWVINPENENLDKMMIRLQNYANSLTGPQNIQLNFKNLASDPTRRINMDVLKNLYLVCKEAMNNALKYSGCRTLNCFFVTEGDNLKIIIEDDGRGFDRETIIAGNGLRNMEKRAAEIGAMLQVGSQPGKGTKITLQMKIPRLSET